MAENARAISELGKDLYKRLADVAKYVQDLGKAIDKVVKTYNSAVGSLEMRVLPGARRFKELGADVAGVIVAESVPLETTARSLQAPELLGPPDADGTDADIDDPR